MWKHGFLVMVAAALAGCSTRLDHHNASVPAASSLPAARPATGPQATTLAPAGVVPLTAENTRVTFIGKAGTTSHEGTFDRLGGQWELPTADPKDSRLAVQIDVDSLRTRIPLLTSHLKRADFLDTKQFPTATFRSTQISPEAGAGGTTHRVTGEFAIHGISRTVTFPAKLIVGPDMASFEATFPISQTSFGMAAAVEKTQDEVPITVIVNAPRK